MKIFNYLISILFVLTALNPAYAQFTSVQEQSLATKDYAVNGGFENGLAKWKRYQDTGAAPTDCTGGTPTVTLTAPTTNPIQGKASGLLTKPASNVQGQGYALDFVFDKDARTKIISVSGSYEITSGTYSGGTNSTDSDLAVYLYDVDGAQIIQPASYKLDGAVSNQTYNFNAVFQAPQYTTDSRNFRLCLHHATTSASAFSVRLDKVKVNTQFKALGSPRTTAVQYQPTWTGLGGVSSNSMYWQRDGGDLILWGYVIATSPTNNALTFTLPAGLTIDTARLSSNVARRHSFGYANRITSGSTTYSDGTVGATMAVVYQGTNTPQLVYAMGTDAYADVNASSMIVGGNAISIPHLRIPISGWDTTVTMSDSADARVFAAKYTTTSTAAITTSASQVTYTTRVFDTHSSLSGATFTAPAPGFYRVTGSVQLASTSWTTGALTFDLYKNGNLDSVIGYFTQATASAASVSATAVGSTVTQLNAGDTLTFRASQNQTASINLSGVANYNYVAIERLSGLSQIAASETVSARYSTAAGQTIANGAIAIVDYGTKEYDSHNAVTTGASWKFTAPSPGKYLVCAYVRYNATTFTAPNPQPYIQIYKNGSAYGLLDTDQVKATGTQFLKLGGCDHVPLLAGEFFDVRTAHGETTARGLQNNSVVNYISITKVAN